VAAKDLLIFAMGDVIMNRLDYQHRWDAVLPVLSQADIRYCNCEQTLSDRGRAVDASCLPWRMSPEYVPAYKYAGFDVASVNGNHAMEWGPEALLHTMQLLEDNGVKPFGAGKDIDAARSPAIIEKKGTKVAFVGYNSILNWADEADNNWPGVAPMRVQTFYEAMEHNQPGGPPRVRSFADVEDLIRMRDDIARARAQADVVCVTLHWGIHYVRGAMAEYQYEVARAAIDAGADIILGSHPHVLKAMEVYKGKVIFYSLGQFLCDALKQVPGFRASRKIQNLRDFHDFQKPDPEYPLLGVRPGDIVNTGIAKLVVQDKKITKVAFTPMLANKDKEFVVEPVQPGSKDWQRLVHYIEDINHMGGVETQFKIEGDELILPLDDDGVINRPLERKYFNGVTWALR
jgi:poly-gamma-glutamate synthesis protein (capsule biosynthesis protein)